MQASAEDSRDLHFLALDDESEESGDYINECMDNGTDDIMKDTICSLEMTFYFSRETVRRKQRKLSAGNT